MWVLHTTIFFPCFGNGLFLFGGIQKCIILAREARLRNFWQNSKALASMHAVITGPRPGTFITCCILQCAGHQYLSEQKKNGKRAPVVVEDVLRTPQQIDHEMRVGQSPDSRKSRLKLWVIEVQLCATVLAIIGIYRFWSVVMGCNGCGGGWRCQHRPGGQALQVITVHALVACRSLHETPKADILCGPAMHQLCIYVRYMPGKSHCPVVRVPLDSLLGMVIKEPHTHSSIVHCHTALSVRCADGSKVSDEMVAGYLACTHQASWQKGGVCSRWLHVHLLRNRAGEPYGSLSCSQSLPHDASLTKMLPTASTELVRPEKETKAEPREYWTLGESRSCSPSSRTGQRSSQLPLQSHGEMVGSRHGCAKVCNVAS